MKNTLSKFAPMLIGAIISGIIGAAPLATGGQKPIIIIWSALAAGATYIKGKLEEKP